MRISSLPTLLLLTSLPLSLLPAACGGEDDVPATTSSSGGPGDNDASAFVDGALPTDASAEVDPLLGLPASFLRLGLVGTANDSNQPFQWGFRLYPLGENMNQGSGRCEAIRREGNCLIETCARAGDPLPPGAPWAGTITITNETTAAAPLTVDLGAQTQEHAFAQPLALTARPGDVLHIVATNVSNYPPIDVRLTTPSVARYLVAEEPLSSDDENVVLSPSGADALRFDINYSSDSDVLRTASCYFDRTQIEHTLPALPALGFPACAPRARSTSLIGIGQAHTVVANAAGAPAFVYVATSNPVRSYYACDERDAGTHPDASTTRPDAAADADAAGN